MKRTVVGAAALAAAGLFGSVADEGMSVAQSGAPVVHHDVALVDNASVLLGAESAFTTELYNVFVAPTGLEATLYNGLGSAANATLILDTGGAADGTYGLTAATDYLDSFNGSLTSFYDGIIANTVAFEANTNALLGIATAASQSALLSQFDAAYIGEGLGNVDPIINTGSGFASDLTALANSDYTQAFSQLTDYFTYLGTNTNDIVSGLATVDLTTLFTGLSSGLETGLTGLSTDFTALLTAIGAFF